MNTHIYVVIVAWDCPQGQICDEILGADSEKAVEELAEKHWQSWLKALPQKRKLRWVHNFAQEHYLNIPYYRSYPAESFERLKLGYPHHAAFIDNLWKPEIEDRVKQLLEMWGKSEPDQEDDSEDYSADYNFHHRSRLYAEKELIKLGYVYSYKERIWYPPNGIKV